jgi:phosphoesterase RecJ-like protein
MIIKKVINILKQNSKFLITSHINLEADALGSELALARLLKDEGKTAVIINEDRIPKEYSFLPGIREIMIIKGESVHLPEQIRDFDVAVVLDCSDINRCGKVKDLIGEDKLILNIDHHRANKRFGTINWLEPDSSSCCEMVYKLYKELNKPIKKDIALLLYTGILTDTGSFRYPNTTWFTHRAVSELFQFKLPISDIYHRIYESIPYSDAKLIPQILSSLRKDTSGKPIFYLSMDREILKRKRSHYDLTENILNFIRSIRGGELFILFKEISPEETRVNLRSKGKFDVAKLARYFGGGGHKTAAGCTIKKSLEEAKDLVLEKAKRLM